MAVTPGYAPNGMKFSGTVLEVPNTTRALYLGEPKEEFQQYAIVGKGDSLFSIALSIPKTGISLVDTILGTSPYEVNIPSPAFGLILSSRHQYGTKPVCSAHGMSTAILLPEDKQEIETGDFIFGHFCSYLSHHRKHIRLLEKTSLSISIPDEDTVLDEYIEEQLKSLCSRVPVSPKYKDYIAEAISRHPQLRESLAHLV